MKGSCANCGSGTSKLEVVDIDGEPEKRCPSCRPSQDDTINYNDMTPTTRLNRDRINALEERVDELENRLEDNDG